MNTITFNGRSFEVWMQESHRKNTEIACIYEVIDGVKGKEPIIMTSFGIMASFKTVVMPWAENALKRYFNLATT